MPMELAHAQKHLSQIGFFSGLGKLFYSSFGFVFLFFRFLVNGLFIKGLS